LVFFRWPAQAFLFVPGTFFPSSLCRAGPFRGLGFFLSEICPFVFFLVPVRVFPFSQFPPCLRPFDRSGCRVKTSSTRPPTKFFFLCRPGWSASFFSCFSFSGPDFSPCPSGIDPSPSRFFPACSGLRVMVRFGSIPPLSLLCTKPAPPPRCSFVAASCNSPPLDFPKLPFFNSPPPLRPLSLSRHCARFRAARGTDNDGFSPLCFHDCTVSTIPLLFFFPPRRHRLKPRLPPVGFPDVLEVRDFSGVTTFVSFSPPIDLPGHCPATIDCRSQPGRCLPPPQPVSCRAHSPFLALKFGKQHAGEFSG